MKLSICLFIAFLLASVVLSIPDQFTIQGQLKDSNSIVLVGSYNMTFYIYDAYTSGNVLWQQSSNVTTDNNGIYTVILQNTNLTFNAPYYLATKVESDNEMSPRLNMSSSGYAVRSNVSDSLNSGGTYYATAYYQGTNKVLDSSGFNGENITGGTVADARIASTIARDSETIAANTSMKNYVDPLFALRLTNHSDASIPQINSSGITVNGYPVCSYAGFNAENLTGGTLADARTSSTLYTYLGGFKADNFTALFTSNYANTGAYNDGNFTTSLSNSGVRTSITNNITTHATTKHGNTTQEMISTINTTGYYQIKTNWSNILNMPAGFSDGTDDTGVGGSASLPGDGIYIYNDTAYRFNETKANSTTDLRINKAAINYTQIINCNFGEYLAMVNGTVKVLRTTDEADYNIAYKYLTNSYTCDQEHFAIGTGSTIHQVIRGVMNFNVSSFVSQTIKKATFRLVLSTYYDPSFKSYPKIYYNYQNPIYTLSTCTADKAACWGNTSLATYLDAWEDIMFYHDGMGDENRDKYADYIDVDITQQLQDALDIGNTTMQIILMMDTDNNQNYTLSGDPSIEFVSSTTWTNGAQTPGVLSSGNTQSRLIVWSSEPNQLAYQCVETLDSQKWGRENPTPKVSKDMLKRVLNNTLMVNWTDILGMPAGFSDGTDDTGGALSGLPGDGIYIYNDTAYRFNETKANSTTDLRITSALSNAGLYNDANTTSVRASITNNITAHEGTFKHGNTSQEMIKAVNTSGYFQHKILAANILLSTWLQNHSDASIPIINASAITIAGIPVATYAGISGENITGGTVADARTSSTLYTYLGGWKLTNFTTAYASTGYWQQANFTTANSGAWKAANNSLDLKNHSDASIPNINVSSITVAGIPVATYAGFAGENITSGIVADARIAATLARDSEVDTVNATQKTYIDTNDALRLMNHSDASIRIVNASSVTIAGVPVATYAGISAGNLTSGTIADARIAATITRDTELTSYITNLTDTNFTKTCWGPVCTWYNYTMGALVTQVT